MYRFWLVFGLLFFSTGVFAEEKLCLSLKEKEASLSKRAERLLTDYKDEVSVFGFSSLMVKEKNFEDAGENIVRMAGIVNGCKALLTEQRCKFVSKEIISLIKDGALLCMNDKKEQCGLC